LTAVNVAGVIVLALALLAPGVLAYVFWPSASVKMKLVPVDAAPGAEAQRAAPRAREVEARLDVPAGFRSSDLSQRPWEELPGGGVRFRD
jgi:hypothetical protein